MNFTPNPVAFTIFGLDIRWYAILICAGMILAVVISMHRAPKRGITQDDLLDTVLISVPVGIVGARAWYVIFEWENYHSLYDVVNIRAGGLAIQGGLIFGMIAAFFVCRHKRISLLAVLDLAIPTVALAQAIGRWGNFFNQEAHGTATDLPWGIMIDGVKVHPTFLYESIWCLLLFIVLSIIDGRKKFRGQTFSLYLILYSLERFFVEQLRTDSLLAGPEKLVMPLKEAGYDPAAVPGVLHAGDFLIYPFRTAQFISLIAIIAGAILYIVMKHINSSNRDRNIEAQIIQNSEAEQTRQQSTVK
ncbi:MAG: prolipoprotein diacylglyceryl transferase [Anaerovoracaceae bacterium]|nr:prolipoprotein diacylglyceryl transferase [Bacillota bacterium]MDY2670184.1 prolipoprotein diacylglyceryl transferase [Anaerovoracaceae bacterium]